MKRQITVVSLGPGPAELLTLETAELLQAGMPLYLRTDQHPVAAWLRQKGIAFKTLDAFYERYEDFDEMHRAMARGLWKKAGEGPLLFAVADAVNDDAVKALCADRPEDSTVEIKAGVSRMDASLAMAQTGSTGGLRVISAMNLQKAGYQPSMPLLVTEIDNAALAGDVKLWLTDLYDDELTVIVFPSSVEKPATMKRMPLL